jgi:hypothetical protein
MIEHLPRAVGKFRVLVFPLGAKLENWRRNESGLYLPEVPPEFDSGWCGNLVVNTGKAITQNQVFGLTTSPVNNTLVGNSNAAPAVGQTALQGASHFAQAFDGGFPTIAGAVITTQSTFAGGSTAFQWLEAGMFAGPANGPANMLDRVIGFGDPTPGGASAVAAWTYTQL